MQGMKEINLNLGSRGYPILLGSDMESDFAAQMKIMFSGRSVALVTNTTLASLYREQIRNWKAELGFVTHVIEDGERYKTLETWSGILDTLLHARLDRKTVIIALGGGVVGDMAGFAAAAFLRGVDYVQVPTTLLAMVDSSVGGKTGVNHEFGKNLIGAFHQPRMVWVDTSYLRTLPRREFLCGYGEMFKNAFIGGADMFAFINDNHETLIQGPGELLSGAIERSILIKARVVEADEKESGMRAILNFGHTFAHALEVFFNYEGILHGEAVLWGIRCAIDLGTRTGTIPAAAQGSYEKLIAKLALPPLPRKPEPLALYEPMFSDKKTSGGSLRFVLPAEPGTALVGKTVGKEQVVATLVDVFGR